MRIPANVVVMMLPVSPSWLRHKRRVSSKFNSEGRRRPPDVQIICSGGVELIAKLWSGARWITDPRVAVPPDTKSNHGTAFWVGMRGTSRVDRDADNVNSFGYGCWEADEKEKQGSNRGSGKCDESMRADKVHDSSVDTRGLESTRPFQPPQTLHPKFTVRWKTQGGEINGKEDERP